MRHTLGILVATAGLLLAAACGADRASDVGEDPGTPASSTSADPSDQPAPGSSLVDIVSQTAAGGDVDRTAIDLGTPQGVADLVDPVSGGLDQQVRDLVAATDVPEGQRLMGAVVNVGCDVPSDVVIRVDGSQVLLEPVFTGERLPECLAAVTSIAVVLVAA
ncbi:exported hypothetical protein [metagenome]|uniref:Uncharacterized protein n=1 Tax=metagenome TaxID=256318 RepID=A0A2P2CDF0_9ZZZZ